MFRRKSKPDADRSSFIDPRDVKRAGREAGEKALDGQANSADFEWYRIYDRGDQQYSIAVGKLTKTGQMVCAIRWNGENSSMQEASKVKHAGTPSQTGTNKIAARWFILPEFLWDAALDACERFERNGLVTVHDRPS